MFFRRSLTSPGATQRLQYPSIKEYTLNYSRDPSMIKGIFLTQGILESLGSYPMQGSSATSPGTEILGTTIRAFKALVNS